MVNFYESDELGECINVDRCPNLTCEKSQCVKHVGEELVKEFFDTAQKYLVDMGLSARQGNRIIEMALDLMKAAASGRKQCVCSCKIITIIEEIIDRELMPEEEIIHITVKA